jgi:hypothetical protein
MRSGTLYPVRWGRGEVGQVFGVIAIGLCLLGVPRQLRAAEDLYGPGGVRPEAVRQGKLGSCYFHAVVAALAQSRPQMFQKMIQSNPDGTYTVQFADGQKENAYPEDLRYTREIGYDLSDGLWVAVVFRAYAQRVLRQSLLDAIEKTELFPVIKGYVKDFIASNDPLLLAYDRAIRAQVDQYGNIDRSKLEAQLKEQMKPLAVSDEIKDSLIGMLASGGFFDALAEVIKQNGELFGAYRAVGQGGIAERVMQTFAGNVKSVMNDSESQAASALERSVKARLPVVACTGGSRFYQQLAAGKALPAETEGWYVNAHCYTVLGFDANTRRVQLRNPWGRHPDPDGFFNLPLLTYVPAFRGIITTE